MHLQAKLIIAKTLIKSILLFVSIAGFLSAILSLLSISLDQWMSATKSSSSSQFRQTAMSDNAQDEKRLSIGLFSFCKTDTNCIFSFYNLVNLVAQKQLTSLSCESDEFSSSAKLEAKQSQIGSLNAAILALIVLAAVFSLIAAFSSLVALGIFGTVPKITNNNENEDHKRMVSNSSRNFEQEDGNNASRYKEEKFDSPYYTGSNFPIYQNYYLSSSSGQRRRRAFGLNQEAAENAKKFKSLKYEHDVNLSAMVNMKNINTSPDFDEIDSDSDEDDEIPCCVKFCAPVLPSLVLPFFVWSFGFFGLSLLLWAIQESVLLNCSWSNSFCDSVVASSDRIFASSSSTAGLFTCEFSHSFYLVSASTVFTFLCSLLLIINRCCFGSAANEIVDEEQFEEDYENEIFSKEEEERLKFAQSEQEKTFRDDQVVSKRMMSGAQNQFAPSNVSSSSFLPQHHHQQDHSPMNSPREGNDDDDDDDNNNKKYLFDIASPRVPPSISTKAASHIFFSDKVALQEECLNRNAEFLSSLIVSARVFETERRRRINISNVENQIRVDIDNRRKKRTVVGSLQNVAKLSGATDRKNVPLQVLDVKKDTQKLAKQFSVGDSFQTPSKMIIEEEDRSMAMMKPSAEAENHHEVEGEETEMKIHQKPKDFGKVLRAAPVFDTSLYEEENDEDDLVDSTLTDTTTDMVTSSRDTSQHPQNNSSAVDASPSVSRSNLLAMRKRPAGAGRFGSSSVSSAPSNNNDNNNNNAEFKFEERPPKMPKALQTRAATAESKSNDDVDDSVEDNNTSNHQHSNLIGGLQLLKLKPPPTPPKSRFGDGGTTDGNDASDLAPTDRFGRPLPRALLKDYENPMIHDESVKNTNSNIQATPLQPQLVSESQQTSMIESSAAAPSSRFADPNSTNVQEKQQQQQQQPKQQSRLAAKTSALRERLHYFHAAEDLEREEQNQEQEEVSSRNNNNNIMKPPLHHQGIVSSSSSGLSIDKRHPMNNNNNHLVSPAVSPVAKETRTQEEEDDAKEDIGQEEENTQQQQTKTVHSFQQYWQRKRSGSLTNASKPSSSYNNSRSASASASGQQQPAQNLKQNFIEDAKKLELFQRSQLFLLEPSLK